MSMLVERPVAEDGKSIIFSELLEKVHLERAKLTVFLLSAKIIHNTQI